MKTIDYSQDQHSLLVQMFRDQEELDEVKPSWIAPDALIIGDRSKFHYDPIGVRIDSLVKLEIGEGLTIGTGVHIASFAHVGIGGGTVTLEDFSAVASGCRIVSGSNQVDALSMSASAPKRLQRIARSFVRLAPYACTLVNSCVLPGVTLHEGAVLAAGGIAREDIPSWEIWGGIPAKKIGNRILQLGKIRVEIV